MGAVMICRDEPVKTPYYIESMGIRLYSMEELAFFLYENVYLADRQMLGKRLWEWLRTEAHNPDLAEKLKKGAEAGSSIQNMVLTILRSVDYYTREELTELSSRMKVLNTYQEQERLKLRADEYFINGNYLASIYEYEKILDIRQSELAGCGVLRPCLEQSGRLLQPFVSVWKGCTGISHILAVPEGSGGSEGVCLFHAAGTVRRRF